MTTTTEQGPSPAGMALVPAGEFPWQNQQLGGYAGTSPVRSFDANGSGCTT